MPPSTNAATRQIRKVAVLGAGTMGSRIAAHLANAGLPVVLLDIVPPGILRRDAEVARAMASRAGSGGGKYRSPKTLSTSKP